LEGPEPLIGAGSEQHSGPQRLSSKGQDPGATPAGFGLGWPQANNKSLPTGRGLGNDFSFTIRWRLSGVGVPASAG
jgi:hypothetical protein